MFALRYEPALRGWSTRVHVASPVQVVIGLGGAPDHAGVEEQRERRSLQRRWRTGAAPVWLPQDLQQQCRDHRVDVDAVDGARNAGIEQRLHQGAVVVVEDVVLAAAPHQVPR